MKQDMKTTVWFGDIKISVGAAEGDDDINNMDFLVERTDYEQDEEGRYCYTLLTIDEVEYLAHRMIDAAAYQRRQNNLVRLGMTDEPQKTVPTIAVTNSECSPTVQEAERDAIIKALIRCNYNRSQTARALNISERTLYRKIKEYGLD